MEDIEFKIKLSKLKNVVSEIKSAYIKNDSVPIIFNEYMGQIILMRGKIATINSLVFMTRDLPIKIPKDIGICVPDEFINYIDKFKSKENVFVNFILNKNTLYVNMVLEESKVSTIYTVKVFENAEAIIPSPKTDVINDIPEKFLTGIKFCSTSISKSKNPSPGTLVWCSDNKIFSTDHERCVSVVDIDETFSNDFSLSKRAIDILSSVTIDSYAIDNRFAFFYSSNQVIGIRQYNFEPPIYFLEYIDGYESFYNIRIPYEVRDRLKEISTMSNKKKSPDINLIESGELMTIKTSASSKKGIKNDIIFETKSENEMVGELSIGMLFVDLEEIIKKSMRFSVDESKELLNVSIGDFNEFNFYMRLHIEIE